MVNDSKHTSDHKRKGATCLNCLVLKNTPELCAMSKGILSKTEIVPDYAKYGCFKYIGEDTETVIVKPTRPQKLIFNEMLGEGITRKQAAEKYGTTDISFDSIMTRIKAKGYTVISSGKKEDRIYKLKTKQ